MTETAAATERRVVTLLFADLVGYTRLCSSLDVEQVYLLVRPLMNSLRRCCEDVGGVVASIEGDGFMAVFGARAAQEDDPARALFAAAEMQRLVEERRAAYGDELRGLHVGLNTGEVLVAPSWESSGFSVSGDPVNVASRLAGLAGESEVLVGSTLAALVGHDDLWSPEMSAQVRNRDDPVRYRAFRWDRSSGSLTRRTRSLLPYVRRESDSALRALVDEGTAVHLLGEPGAGKSRALAELAQELGPRAVSLCVPSFLGRPLRAQLAEALLGRVDDTHLAPLHRRALMSASGANLDTSEVDSPARFEDAVVAALKALARPVLLVDDGHFSSPLEWDLLRSLSARMVPGSALVVASRSDDASAIDAHVLTVSALDERGARDLLGLLLPGAPERLVLLLLDRSGGNPLFLEQGARLLLDDGTVELAAGTCVVRRPELLSDVPLGMRLFVSSRLDLLDERARELLARAAVVGDPVDVDLLRHLDGSEEDFPEVLDLLVHKGLLRWTTGSVLRFKHQVVRDVAYEGLLRSQRASYHRVASEWYSVLPVTGLLSAEAAHLEASIALGEWDCDLVRRTVEVLGQWAMSLLDESTAESLVILDRADALAEAHPVCAVDTLRLVLARAGALERLRLPAAGDVSHQAVALARHRGDEALLVEALVSCAVAEDLQAEPPGHSVLDEALTLLRRRNDDAGEARLLLQKAWRQAERDPRAVVSAAESAYRVGVRAGDPRLAATAATDLAMMLPAQDPASAEHWISVAEGTLRAHDLVTPSKLAFSRALSHSIGLEPLRAMDAARRLRQAASVAMSPRFEAFADLLEMEAATEVGQLAKAEALLEDVRRSARERPLPNVQSNALVREAALRARQGRHDDVARSLQELAGVVGRAGPYLEAALHELRGTTLLERGWFAEAFVDLDLAHRLDQDLEQPALGLRLALRRLVAGLTAGRQVLLADVRQLRATARDIGAPAIAAVAARWLEVDEALRAPHTHELDVPRAPDLAEARALDLELEALRGGDPDGLLAAAAEWSTLGCVIWTARAELWHSELTGSDPSSARDLLTVLEAPEGIEDTFRAQVRHLRA